MEVCEFPSNRCRSRQENSNLNWYFSRQINQSGANCNLRLRNHTNIGSCTCAGCEGALQLACTIHVCCYIGVMCTHTRNDGERKPAAKTQTLRGWQTRGLVRLLLAGFSSSVRREGGACSFRNIGKYSAYCPLRLRYDNNMKFPVYSPQLQCFSTTREECSSADEAKNHLYSRIVKKKIVFLRIY